MGPFLLPLKKREKTSGFIFRLIALDPLEGLAACTFTHGTGIQYPRRRHCFPRKQNRLGEALLFAECVCRNFSAAGSVGEASADHDSIGFGGEIAAGGGVCFDGAQHQERGKNNNSHFKIP